jgi:hypothetical protein
MAVWECDGCTFEWVGSCEVGHAVWYADVCYTATYTSCLPVFGSPLKGHYAACLSWRRTLIRKTSNYRPTGCDLFSGKAFVNSCLCVVSRVERRKCQRGIISWCVSFSSSVCVSVQQHGAVRLPLGGFVRKSLFEYVWKSCRENSNFIKV